MTIRPFCCAQPSSSRSGRRSSRLYLTWFERTGPSVCVLCGLPARERVVRNTRVDDLLLVRQLRERRHRLSKRHDRVRLVKLVQIEPVRAEPAEASSERGARLSARAEAPGGSCLRGTLRHVDPPRALPTILSDLPNP